MNKKLLQRAFGTIDSAWGRCVKNSFVLVAREENGKKGLCMARDDECTE